MEVRPGKWRRVSGGVGLSGDLALVPHALHFLHLCGMRNFCPTFPLSCHAFPDVVVCSLQSPEAQTNVSTFMVLECFTHSKDQDNKRYQAAAVCWVHKTKNFYLCVCVNMCTCVCRFLACTLAHRGPQWNRRLDLSTADTMMEVSFGPWDPAFRQHHPPKQEQRPNPSKSRALGKPLNALTLLFDSCSSASG